MTRLIAIITLACGVGVFAHASNSTSHGLFASAAATEFDHHSGNPILLASGGYDVQPSQRPSYLS